MSHVSNSESNSNNNDARTALAVPNPEVIVKPHPRHFTAEYKQRILQEAEACASD